MDYITKARLAVNVEWENEIGGIDENYFIGEKYIITTKHGKTYAGVLIGYEASNDDLTQDALVLDCARKENDIQKIGIYSITVIKRW